MSKTIVVDFNVWTNRWEHYDHHQLTWTESGWLLRGFREEACAPSGAPGLFKALDHDCVAYPSSLGFVLECLWKMHRDGGIAPAAVVAALKDVAEWISVCERAKPESIRSAQITS